MCLSLCVFVYVYVCVCVCACVCARFHPAGQLRIIHCGLVALRSLVLDLLRSNCRLTYFTT